MRFLLYTILAIIFTLIISYATFLFFDWGLEGEFKKDVDWLFWFCVRLLQDWGNWTGLGYNLLNIIIFIILQPLLILFFFILWRVEVSRRKERTKY